ncbi:hypothetical protein LDFHOB_09220 [Candidatus Electronema aureum]
MSSTRKVPAQGTISYLTGRPIFGCRFFAFPVQKYLQADCFGAEFLSLLAGRLIAAGDVCVNFSARCLRPAVQGRSGVFA